MNNEELSDLQTHAAGATDLHKTRTTEQPVQIDPPANPNPGPVDMRNSRFEMKNAASAAPETANPLTEESCRAGLDE